MCNMQTRHRICHNAFKTEIQFKSPLEYHYACLKNVARYLWATKQWGIQFCSRPSNKNHNIELARLEPSEKQSQIDKLPNYPEPISAGKLIGMVDVAYANNLSKQRSTTGYVFTYSGGAVVYRSKTQPWSILIFYFKMRSFALLLYTIETVRFDSIKQGMKPVIAL